jgi:hypothetical protein
MRPSTFGGCSFLAAGGYPCDLSHLKRPDLCDPCQAHIAKKEKAMSEHVKVGQVWASKNTGKQMTITGVYENRVLMKDARGWTYDDFEWRLLSDFVLVMDAP